MTRAVGSHAVGAAIGYSIVHLRNAARAFALLATAILLAACQSAGPEDVLGLDSVPPAPAREVTGAGPVVVTLLLPRTSAPATAALARDMHDGAKLAIEELGGGTVQLLTIDTKGQPPAARAMAEQAGTSGSKLILVGLDRASAAAIAGIPAAQRPPVIDLSSPLAVAKGVYGFASDEISSALEGVRTAVAGKQSRVAVAVPESMSAPDIERLRRGISDSGATLTGLVKYPAASGAVAAAVASSRAAFEKATTLVIFGQGAAPAEVAQAVAASGAGNNITTLVGNSSWSPLIFRQPVLNGALVAMIDQESLIKLDERYKSATGRPLSLEAALAYDAAALGAGLVRSGGADAINAGVLTSKSGFRGATGVFRFGGDGAVERLHAIYRIENGQLTRLSGDLEGF